MILPQPLRHILAPKLPQVRFLASASDTADLTTYTFTNMDIGGFGGGTPFATAVENGTFDTFPTLAASQKKMVLAIVHGEDTAANFNVSSVTIGGVGGTELVDRGGGTNAINTAIYGWSDQALAGIANTDVVVGWSEAITGCAVGIVEVRFLRSYAAIASDSGTNAATIAMSPPVAVTEGMHGGVFIVGTTCATGGGTEQVDFPIADGSALAPILLYAENNAEIDFAAAFYLTPSVFLNTAAVSRSNINITWSGAGVGDGAAVFLL